MVSGSGSGWWMVRTSSHTTGMVYNLSAPQHSTTHPTAPFTPSRKDPQRVKTYLKTKTSLYSLLKNESRFLQLRQTCPKTRASLFSDGWHVLCLLSPSRHLSSYLALCLFPYELAHQRHARHSRVYSGISLHCRDAHVQSDQSRPNHH